MVGGRHLSPIPPKGGVVDAYSLAGKSASATLAE
jgi:hypothetical protein